MKFSIEREELLDSIRIVERATIQKGLQPVLANILIETIDKKTLRFSATDLDITVISQSAAEIEEEGKITLPAKILSDIVVRLNEKKVEFELKDSNIMKIKCQRAKFEIIGISAEEFPNLGEKEEEEFIEIEKKPFTKAIKQAGFAAAGLEGNSLLSGVVCEIKEKELEMASTDGNRLARVREKIKNSQEKNNRLIIPSKTLQEFVKISPYIKEEKIKIAAQKTKLVIKSEKITLISRLLEGQYPKYNQLIPTECPKEAKVNIQALINALERVSVLVNEKTSIVKFEFSENKLTMKADTPDEGASEDALDIDYKEEEMKIAFNYKYVIESLRNMESEEVMIGMNSPLSATVFKPNSEEDYICLVMPVQIKQ